jgi:copper(I)-binding protein
MRAADRNMAVEIYSSTALNVGGPHMLLMDDNDDLKRIACATNFLLVLQLCQY